MTLDYNVLNKIASEYGESFYLLDKNQFEENYNKLLEAFRKFYSNTSIAYSYKTNYLPVLCEKIKSLGGYAEIVSEMELYLAEKIGVPYEDIYYNGPWKKREYVEKMLLQGGYINIDGFYEVDMIIDIARSYADIDFEVGLRIAGDIGQDEPSRFGFCVENGDLLKAYKTLQAESNIEVVGLHLHLPYRMIDTYKGRMEYMRKALGLFADKEFKYISLGGGYMGEIPDEMKKEFSFEPPTFDDYAKIVAGEFASIMEEQNLSTKLIIEPGSALVANCMKLVTSVINIKESRDKYIATISGSTYQMNPSVKNVKRSIKVFSPNDSDGRYYSGIDMAGYTCIEGDYLYRNYEGELSVGDYVVFDNVGSYSIVMKPPFILPDVAVISIEDNGIKSEVNRQLEENVFVRFLMSSEK